MNPADDEQEIRRTFDMALAVRGESEDAQHVADRYFFETLARMHRANEGGPFTGLKSDGTVDPAIAAADLAPAKGSIGALAGAMATDVEDEIKRRFAEAHETGQVAEDSVEQGRAYVAAYVQLNPSSWAWTTSSAPGPITWCRTGPTR